MHLNPSLRPRLVAVLAGTIALAACTSPTAYRPAAGVGPSATGYTDQRIEADRFRVSFAGNSATSREQVEKYLLYRAAELTVQNGFDNFVFVNRDTEKKTRTHVDQFGASAGYYGQGFGYWGPSWRYARRGLGFGGWAGYGRDPFFNNYQVRQIDRYEAVAEIVAGRGPKPAADRFAFDARQVLENLGPTIEHPAGRSR